MSGVISAQVTDDLLERINAVRDGEPPDYDESRSATVRRLVRRGLEAAEADADTATDDTDTARDRLIRAVVMAFMMGYPTLAAASGRLNTAVAFIGVVTLTLVFEGAARDALSGLKSTLKT